MTNQSTIDKLIEMRLTTMADAFRNQLDDPKFKEVPFEDRFGMLVDIEYSNRKNNRQKRLIRNAGFDQPEANIMDINYTSGRRLNKELINRLATCEYISEHRNLFITGATGCGKTYMACAFGMEACKQYYNTRYVRMPDLLMDLDIARTEGNYRKVMAKYSNPVLLILDEWMLLKPTDTEQKDIFELLHRRRKKSSTIFCSQYVFEEWYDQLGGEASPLADAIIDRIAHIIFVFPMLVPIFLVPALKNNLYRHILIKTCNMFKVVLYLSVFSFLPAVIFHYRIIKFSVIYPLNILKQIRRSINQPNII